MSRSELLSLVRETRRSLLVLEEEGGFLPKVDSRRACGVAGTVPLPAVPGEKSGGPMGSPGAAEWEALKKEVGDCRKCPLGRVRIQAVFGVGNPQAQVMFIGEGPGYEEDRRGEPFVGRAGQLLDKILASIGLNRQVVYIANVVKCHPMIDPSDPEKRGNDRPPAPEEIEACRGYLERQIRHIRPRILVPLGSVAARAILRTSQGISGLRGRWYDYPDPGFSDLSLRVLPTYHPAALLRNPELKKEVWQDMKLLKKEIEAKSVN